MTHHISSGVWGLGIGDWGLGTLGSDGLWMGIQTPPKSYKNIFPVRTDALIRASVLPVPSPQRMRESGWEDTDLTR
ncbi:hypothetical protein SD81_027840 [Tolypothrix campylonemoides VB511288]|nr:hypothetical protein SD81_027840 [Tolypothrix campylonemoides VB511288]